MKRFNIVLALLVAVSLNACDLINTEDEGDIVIVSENITTPTTWVSSKVYVIEYGIYIDANLTIEPGTTIKFKSGTWLSFGGSENMTLTANGTAEKPIVFTSYSSTPAAGAWQGLWFESHVLSNSSMSFCEVNYAGESNYHALTVNRKISMNNCTVSHVKKDGIYSHEGFVSFTGNTISNMGGHAIEVECIGLNTIGDNNNITCAQGYGILIRSGSIADNSAETWHKQTVPYYIEGGIYVDKNLTIQAGTTLKFMASAWLEFGSTNSTTLNAVGTEAEPIVFTSAASTPAPGAWAGLFFADNTTANTLLKYCTVEYAGKDYDRANITINHVDGITLENCTIRNSSGYGVFLYSSTWNNVNNTFANNALGNIHVSE